MRSIFVVGLTALWALSLAACATEPKTDTEKSELQDEVQETITALKEKDPSLKDFFNGAYGYVVFPTVGKGGLVVGGAGGRGEVYEQGRMIGWATLSQGTVGLQVGGQTYSEVIFFERKSALDAFTAGEFAFAGQASGVVAETGAAADAAYKNSVAVFTMPKAGFMGEASIGGQNFAFEPK